MYCRNCGSEVNDNAVVCVHCGAMLDDRVSFDGKQIQNNKSNTIGLVGFILSFFVSFAIAGLICSIIGYMRAKNEGGGYKRLSLAGIIISASILGLTVIGLIISGIVS